MENAEFILNEMRRQAELSPEERLAQEYNKMMEPYFIKRGIEYPDPEYLIEIGGVPTMPKGNLVAVSAKWKNGKTFFCSILTAIFMGSDQFANCRSLKETGKALFFDTEQSDSDTKRLQSYLRGSFIFMFFEYKIINIFRSPHLQLLFCGSTKCITGSHNNVPSE